MSKYCRYTVYRRNFADMILRQRCKIHWLISSLRVSVVLCWKWYEKLPFHDRSLFSRPDVPQCDMCIIFVNRTIKVTVFLFVSGYSRSASSDMVQIKLWVCHISSTIMADNQAHVVNGCFSHRLSPWLGCLSFW